jgi:cytidyltransferase-like protein
MKPVRDNQVVVQGAFDDLRTADIRFLEEASRSGPLTVLLWSDDEVRRQLGQPPKFPAAERRYLLSAIRYVHDVRWVPGPVESASLPEFPDFCPDIWAVTPGPHDAARAAHARARGIELLPLAQIPDALPEPPPQPLRPGRKKIVVTGCYDWLHSGHVRFFEEVSALGDLFVVVGHDANIRLLKGEGHPLLPQAERRYQVGSVRFVTQALISSGEGWLDADPEIRRIRPDIYAVNQDGDQGGKREYCRQNGIEYRVLERLPAPGLPRRSSTDLRGF